MPKVPPVEVAAAAAEATLSKRPVKTSGIRKEMHALVLELKALRTVIQARRGGATKPPPPRRTTKAKKPPRAKARRAKK